jgi:hypothetical protein
MGTNPSGFPQHSCLNSTTSRVPNMRGAIKIGAASTDADATHGEKPVRGRSLALGLDLGELLPPGRHLDVRHF